MGEVGLSDFALLGGTVRPRKLPKGGCYLLKGPLVAPRAGNKYFSRSELSNASLRDSL